MRVRPTVLCLVTAALTACGSLPWTGYGEPHIDCSPWLMPGTRLTWAGRGDVVALGLATDPNASYTADERDSAIYVGRTDGIENFDLAPGTLVWCAHEGDHVFLGEAPEDWEPP